MIIKCATNSIENIPKEYLELHQTDCEDDPLLTVGKEYTVTGIEFSTGRLIYIAQLDSGALYRTTPVLFTVVSDVLPKDWVFRDYTVEDNHIYALSFKEWFTADFEYRYSEGGEREVALVLQKVQEYNRLA